MYNKVEVGDIVTVNFHGSRITLCNRATVKYTPCSTGDSWIFEDESGDIHYVSEGCTITKKENTDAS